MPKKEQPHKIVEVPMPAKDPEIPRDDFPEIPLPPVEVPEVIPEEDPFENPPNEIPEPGEGP